jgi:hypothetical protein
MSENRSAQAHSRRGAAGAEPVPSPDQAMAMYYLATRIVDLQLQRLDRGDCDDQELAVTREVLLDTHRMLSAALDGISDDARPALQVVPPHPPRGS